MAMDDEHTLAATWYYGEHFGFATAPSQTDREVTRNMALAVLAVANADGQVSPEERAWLVGYFAAKGYPSEVIAEVQTLTPPDLAAVPALMDLGILRLARRILIYDAIRAASTDGYHPREREAVRTVASALGVDVPTVEELERQVEAEEALKVKRIKLLMPDGFPNLHPRYRP